MAPGWLGGSWPGAANAAAGAIGGYFSCGQAHASVDEGEIVVTADASQDNAHPEYVAFLS